MPRKWTLPSTSVVHKTGKHRQKCENISIFTSKLRTPMILCFWTNNSSCRHTNLSWNAIQYSDPSLQTENGFKMTSQSGRIRPLVISTQPFKCCNSIGLPHFLISIRCMVQNKPLVIFLKNLALLKWPHYASRLAECVNCSYFSPIRAGSATIILSAAVTAGGTVCFGSTERYKFSTALSSHSIEKFRDRAY